MLFPSSQTRSFSLKVREGVSGPTCFMTLAATRRAAVTSFRIWSSVCRRSSTVGMVVVKFTGGMNSGS